MSKKMYNIDIYWNQNGHNAQANFNIHAGITALIGPSGAGKTTIARMIAGLQKPEAGNISGPDTLFFDSISSTNIAVARRKVGYVTQEPTLFPTMSVQDNIMLGATLSKAYLQELYEISGISHLLKRHPSTLSGGEAKRVSIVRALATAPKLLILDEPMNGLDPIRKRSLLRDIRALSLTTNTPILLITHQVEEMLLVADYAVLIASGNTLVSGSIEKVLSAPETSEHMGLDDAGTVVSAIVLTRRDGLLKAQTGEQILWLTDEGERTGSKLRLRILARDVGISLSHHRDVSILNQIEATVTQIATLNKDVLLTMDLTSADQKITARITEKSANALMLEVGSHVYALIKAVAVKELMVD